MKYVFLLQTSGNSQPWLQSSTSSKAPVLTVIGFLFIAVGVVALFALTGLTAVFLLAHLLAKMIWILCGLVMLFLASATIVLWRAFTLRTTGAKPRADFLVIDESGFYQRIRRNTRFMPWDSIQDVVWRAGRLTVINEDSETLQYEVEAGSDFDAEIFLNFCRSRTVTAQR